MKNIPLPLILGAVAVGGYLILTRDNKDKVTDGGEPSPTPTPTPTPDLDPTAYYDDSQLISEINNVKALAESNSSAINTKANASSLASYTPIGEFNTYKSTTNSTLSGKANQSSLDNLQSDVSSKASTNYVNTQLGGKLDASAADDFASAAELETYKSSTDSALSGKANQSALNSFQTQTTGFFTDYGNQLSALDSELGTYKGSTDAELAGLQSGLNAKADAGYVSSNFGLINSDIDAISQDVDGMDVNIQTALDDSNYAKGIANINQSSISNLNSYQQNTIIPNIVDNQGDIVTNAGNIASNTSTLGQKANTSYVNNELSVLQGQVDALAAPNTSGNSPAFFSGGSRTYRNNTFNFDGSVDHKRGVGQIGFIPNAW